MSQTTDPVSVTLEREEWQALLDAVPVTALGYGSRAWGVYQAVQRALKGDKPTERS